MLSLLQERKRAKLTDAEFETVGDQRSRVSLKWLPEQQKRLAFPP